MAFEKAKEYLEGYGLADRIIVTEQSSATVTAAAKLVILALSVGHRSDIYKQ